MQELIIKNKLKYLKENYPLGDVSKLTDCKRCIHCDTIFEVNDYKVFRDNEGEEFICCPHAPQCSGTVIDWLDIESTNQNALISRFLG